MIYLWIIYCLILVIGLFGVSLTTAHSLSDFVVPLLLLPLLPTLYQDFRRYLRSQARRVKSHSTLFASTLPTRPLTTIPAGFGEIVEPATGINDSNRRLFLRLIGSSGLAVFFMAVLGKGSAQAAFFGSMPGPGTVALKNSSGNTIDPAESQPTDGYTITEVDEGTTESYYGFVNKNGAWYITKETSTGAYRYRKGGSDFSSAWDLRADPLTTYDYFDNVF